MCYSILQTVVSYSKRETKQGSLPSHLPLQQQQQQQQRIGRNKSYNNTSKCVHGNPLKRMQSYDCINATLYCTATTAGGESWAWGNFRRGDQELRHTSQLKETRKN